MDQTAEKYSLSKLMRVCGAGGRDETVKEKHNFEKSRNLNTGNI